MKPGGSGTMTGTGLTEGGGPSAGVGHPDSQGVDPRARELRARDIDVIYRQIREDREDPQLRVMFLGNHTLDVLARQVSVRSFLEGIRIEARTGPFGQHVQMILDPESVLGRWAPHVIVLSLALGRLAPALVSGLAGMGEDERRREVGRVMGGLRAWVVAAKARSDATILITTFVRPAASHLGLADAKSPLGEGEIYRTLNLELLREFAHDPQVHVVDADHAVARAGSREARNDRMFHLAKLEWDEVATGEVASLLTRYMRALVVPARKCIVVDLDHTLWGGIVGEEGPAGVRIGEGDPLGEAHRAFQLVLKSLRNRGILLAICSKNNLDDAREVFETRPEMPLAWDDFAAYRINWDPKHLNILQIAEELNIGVDSVVFLDDNPAERELVRQMLPDVVTFPLPEDPADYATSLLESWLWDQLVLTEEDTRKTEQYRENTLREESRAQMTDLDGYLESLDTRLEIRRAGRGDLSRVHQLFAKTNQFNLTTRRYRPAELENFLRGGGWRLEVVQASDRFGSLGVVGTYLLRIEGDVVEVDSLILSCRAMGRGIETAMCNRIKEIAREVAGARILQGRFRPTRRNAPAAGFWQREGFELADSDGVGAAKSGPDGPDPAGDGSEEEGSLWKVSVAEAEKCPCPGITVTIGEGA